MGSFNGKYVLIATIMADLKNYLGIFFPLDDKRFVNGIGNTYQ